jgi:hypothetical protein
MTLLLEEATKTRAILNDVFSFNVIAPRESIIRLSRQTKPSSQRLHDCAAAAARVIVTRAPIPA